MWSASIMPFNAWNRGHVPAHYNHRLRANSRDHAAHLAHLTDIHDDGRNANHVVLLLLSARGQSASRVGKSSTVQGAEIFAWIIMMPHERWNMRSEKLPGRA